MKSKSIFWVVGVSLALVAGCSGFKKKEMAANSYLNDKVTIRRVQNSLRHQPGDPFANLHVTSTNGVVYLGGSVPTQEQRQQAEGVARQIDGVKDVQNQIRVHQQEH